MIYKYYFAEQIRLYRISLIDSYSIGYATIAVVSKKGNIYIWGYTLGLCPNIYIGTPQRMLFPYKVKTIYLGPTVCACITYTDDIYLSGIYMEHSIHNTKLLCVSIYDISLNVANMFFSNYQIIILWKSGNISIYGGLNYIMTITAGKLGFPFLESIKCSHLSVNRFEVLVMMHVSNTLYKINLATLKNM